MKGKKAGPPDTSSALRQRAEERLEKSGPSAGRFAGLERERLIQEMQVYTIELEMQNEELKRLKNEAEILAERYRDIYDFAPVGYFTLDADGAIVEANLTGASLIGIPRDGLRERRMNAFVAPRTLPAFNAFLKKVFRTGEPGNCEIEIGRADGPPLQVQLEARLSPDGRQCRLAIIDITERRKAEEGLNRYELLALRGREIILFADCESGRILEANAAAVKAYGYSREELCKLHLADLCTTSAMAEAVARAGEIEDDWPLFESPHRRRDGSLFPAEIALGSATVGDRRTIVAVIRDITLRRAAEQAVEERQRELADANRELESFSYSVSHDLQTPLRAIDGYARMILRTKSEQFDEETRSKFDVIRSNVQKMGRLIDNLLAFSRLGRKQLRVEVLSMEAIVKEAWEALKSVYPDRAITLKMDGLPPGMGDPILIQQVFDNLLSNALKFTRTREEAVVEVSGRVEGDESVYTVRDNGAGFDMAYYGKLFAMFQRLHMPGEYEGTGVGLAIAQRIVLMHGGRIWAEGEVDRGAAFHFSLPNRSGAGVGHPQENGLRGSEHPQA